MDETAKVWDVDTGLLIVTLRGHEGSIDSAAFSPDGRRIVTTGTDATAKIWESDTGRELLTLREQYASLQQSSAPITLHTATFSPEGRRVLRAVNTFDGFGSTVIWNTLPWRDEDLPGDASMSYDERIRLYKLEQWKKRQDEEQRKSKK